MKALALVEESRVAIPVGRVTLEGSLAMPEAATGIVLFAHGSGGGRLSARNRFVAEVLQKKGLATLLIDLLSAQEEEIDEKTGQLRFDIGLLANRVVEATDWLSRERETCALRIGVFGASTGAAAALLAAVERPDAVRAVVSRGGRPDLAGAALPHVKAPTLLVVGGNDLAVLRLNRETLPRLACEKKLEIVPDSTHLFEEPGALGAVSRLASDWFGRHLARL